MSRETEKIPLICRLKRKLGIDGGSPSALFMCRWSFRNRPFNKCTTCPIKSKNLFAEGFSLGVENKAMLNKEEIENNTLKVSIPLISDEDIRIIDNNFESTINEFNKQLVHDKDLAIAQYIVTKQQRQIKQLEKEKQKVIDKLEEDMTDIQEEFEKSKESVDWYIESEKCAYAEVIVKEILSILKGE